MLLERQTNLIYISSDEKVVAEAVELNDQLQKLLTRHDALISDRPTPIVNQLNQEEVDEEEEAEQLFRRSVHLIRF